MNDKTNEQDPLKQIMQACRTAFIAMGVFSFFVNVLMLTAPIYMLQLFDRVLASQSYATLLYLTIIAIIALLVLSLLDIVRNKILLITSNWLEQRLAPLALEKSIDNQLLGGNYSAQCLLDIAGIRQFLSSTHVSAFFDAPWVPIYLIVIFFLSVSLGFLATLGAVILFALAWLNESVSREPNKIAAHLQMENQQFIQDALKNAESIQAMGMQKKVFSPWIDINKKILTLQDLAGGRNQLILGAAKFIRMTLQILVLGIGAYLVIQGDFTAGAMIAASIIMARALAPIEQAMGTWRAFFSTYQGYQRLKAYLNTPAARQNTMKLPKPLGMLQVENASFALPEHEKPILQGIQFTVSPGKSLAIIGPSGAGKSTLARLLVGIWLPSYGQVRLDSAPIYHWSPEDLGEYLGYLPQNAALFPGSVKSNIARLQEVDEDKVIAAAKFVNAHQIILHLSEGYETETSGFHLSGGQKQRVALARAFYGDPRLVVLDEPETYLDEEGFLSLQSTLKAAKEKQITVIVITQRPQLAALADNILILNQGKIQQYDQAEKIMTLWQGKGKVQKS